MDTAIYLVMFLCYNKHAEIHTHHLQTEELG